VKLEGSLDAFSLPDIFQLLSNTGKTGGLHLAHDGSDGVVFFANGKVTGASADGSRQPLARRLIGSGAVADDALAAAVERASGGEGVGVVKALLESQAVEPELLRQAVSDQSVDAVFDLLRWGNGDFAFVMDEANPDDVGVSLVVETVLTDADSRRDSWDSVSRVVSAPTAVLSMPVVLPQDPAVTRDEWALLALIDGRRSVSDLVDLTGCGQYAVVSTLAGLVERGLLAVQADGEDHVSVVVRRQQLLGSLEGLPVTPAVAAEAADAPIASPPAPRVGTSRGVASGGEVASPDAAGFADPADSAVPASPAAAESAEGAELVTASMQSAGEGPTMLGGAHVPGDVVPPRAEPFLPKRQADFDDAPSRPGGGDVIGAIAVALDPQSSMIERDPSVNRSLMLRLIAGVRGL